ncbi:MAG: 3'-5' exonuclease, partial [Oscillospiraceae bacterium]
VNIMSIHASKGLEFPVCIVAALHKKFNMRDTMANVLLDEQLGLGINLKNKNGTLYRTVPHEAIASRIKKEQLSEEMRV